MATSEVHSDADEIENVAVGNGLDFGGDEEARHDPGRSVLVLKHEAWVQLIDINLWDAIIGEIMFDRVREDQHAHRSVCTAEYVDGFVDVSEGGNRGFINLVEPGAFETGAPADDPSTGGNAPYIS